jgi:hypothetical protein
VIEMAVAVYRRGHWLVSSVSDVRIMWNITMVLLATVTLKFTSLSCIRLLVVTTDYTLVLYLCRGEGSTYRNWGKTASLYMF